MNKRVVTTVVCAGVFLIGGLLNYIVRTVNHGMPVAAPQSWLPVSGYWTAITPNTQLPFLGDVIHVGTRYFSIGDIFMWTTIVPMLLGTVYLVVKIGRLIDRQTTTKSEVRHVTPNS